MADQQPQHPAVSDADLQREIRDGRKFTLAEAIGRLAGPGSMKGESPITRKQQAEAIVEAYLDCHLNDSAGALRAVLLRQVRESALLDEYLDQPLAALSAHVQRVLESEYILQELVRQSDVEWGRVFGERPHFQKPGCTPHEDDPYTIESVRACLSQFGEKLFAEECGPKSGREVTQK
jgi:hypothetical protein